MNRMCLGEKLGRSRMKRVQELLQMPGLVAWDLRSSFRPEGVVIDMCPKTEMPEIEPGRGDCHKDRALIHRGDI